MLIIKLNKILTIKIKFPMASQCQKLMKTIKILMEIMMNILMNLIGILFIFMSFHL